MDFTLKFQNIENFKEVVNNEEEVINNLQVVKENVEEVIENVEEIIENIYNLENVEQVVNNLENVENINNLQVVEEVVKEVIEEVFDEVEKNLENNEKVIKEVIEEVKVDNFREHNESQNNTIDEKLLFDANRKLGINEDLSKAQNKNLIFVFSPAKCGSTSLVSSLRLSCFGKFTVIHIHNDQMLHFIYNVDESIRLLDIIQFNQHIGKNVFVFDIFRTPVEQKMSLFFDLLGSYHFNRNKEAMTQLDVDIVIHRFNKVYPHISYPDYFTNLFPTIDEFETFDNKNGFLVSDDNYGVKYVKLRISDFSTKWVSILQNLLKTKILLVRDNTTSQFVDLYKNFKNKYQLPTNFFDDLKTLPILDFYLTEQEKIDYIAGWEKNTSNQSFLPYTSQEYSLYCQIATENKYINTQQYNHYFDNGCDCPKCQQKRKTVLNKPNNLVNTKRHLMRFY